MECQFIRRTYGAQKFKSKFDFCTSYNRNYRKAGIFMPRIDLGPTITDLPVLLKRRQFLIKMAFIMAINKSQEKKLEKVRIYLPEIVLSHGHPYVS